MPKKGFRFTLQSIEKMRLAHIGKHPSLATRLKMSKSSHHFSGMLGKKHTVETKEKIRIAHLGKIHSKKWNKNAGLGHRDGKSYAWKGDNVGSSALHEWVARRLGKPRVCAHCGTVTAKIYDWSNNSGLYKRDLSDWERLCRSCHIKKDGASKTHSRNTRFDNHIK